MAKSIVSILISWSAMTALTTALGAPYGNAPLVVVPVVLQDVEEYPNAGIAIAVPEAFEHKLVSAPFDVLSAGIEEGDRPSQAVTLSAFPITDRGTAEEFAEAKMAELNRNLAIRDLKTHKKTPIPVAGAKGAARLVSYSFRGTQSVAAQVYFLRDVKGSHTRICYLLTVVTTAQKQSKLLGVLGAVIKSIRFIEVKAPEIPAEAQLEKPVKDNELGFSIRSPKGWYIDHSGAGVETGLIDYRLGGIPMPSVKIVAVPASADAATSEACSKKFLAMAQSVAARDKQETRTLSDVKAKLGNLPGQQFVLRLIEKPNPTPSLGGRESGDVVLVHRTACLSRAGTDPVAYVVVITAKAAECAAAEKLMDTMAATFKVLGPATQPATATATTQPAAPK